MRHDASSSTSSIEDSAGTENAVPILSVRAFLRDFTFGSTAGMISEIFEYPFDLAKVRLQAQLLSNTSNESLPFNGPMDCLRQTWREEGFRGLYRGFTVPLIGAMAETAALFLAYGSFQNVLRAYPHPLLGSNSDSTNNQLSITQLGLAAAAAGFATSFVVTPIELVKCRMQVQMMGLHVPQPPMTSRVPTVLDSVATAAALPVGPKVHRSSSPTVSRKQPAEISRRGLSTETRPVTHQPGPWQITKTILSTEGFRGLWVGHSATILRDTGMTVSWFVVKEYTAKLMRDYRISKLPTLEERKREEQKNEPTMWESGISGAFSGGFCVLALYPADTVKSAMQTDLQNGGVSRSANSGTGNGKSPSFWNLGKTMYRSHGLRGLYAGCGMTIARAVPSSGIVFVVYDQLGKVFP